MAAESAALRRGAQPRPEEPRAESRPVRTAPRPDAHAAPRPAAVRPPQQRPAAPIGAQPRVVPGRPRPLVTGQVPIARTRVVPAGRTGTAQLPIVRPEPAAAPVDADRRRLRQAPPAPAPAPVIVRTPPAAPPAPSARSRRPARCLFAVLAAIGLVAIHALPSLAAADAPPVAGVQEDDDVQQFQVGQVDDAGAQMDGVSGQMPVAAPTWVVPMKAELRDGFGPRLQQPVAGVNLFHRGQDIGGPCGAPIHAAAAGVVETASWWGTYGNWTLVNHGGGIETGYAHQARILVRPGQHVSANQVIGYEGTTGASTGCHLHLEVHINGVAVNPVPFFKAKGIPLGP